MDKKLTVEQIEKVRHYGLHSVSFSERAEFLIALCDLALAGLEGQKDAGYYKWRLAEIMPLFEEARDALLEPQPWGSAEEQTHGRLVRVRNGLLHMERVTA